MQKLTAIGTVGKKITVSSENDLRKFEFFVNVKEKRTDSDGAPYEYVTTVRCRAYRRYEDTELDSLLCVGVGVCVRGVAEAALIKKDDKEFAVLDIKNATVSVLGKIEGNSIFMDAVGFVGSVSFNDVGENSVCNFSIAHNVLIRNTGEVSAIWMRCALWRAKDKTKIFDYLKVGQLVAVSVVPGIRAYTSKTGEACASMDCKVNTVELLGGKKDKEESEQKAVKLIDDDLPF